MKVLVKVKSCDATPLVKEFVHDDVYVFTQNDDCYDIIKKGGGKLRYSAKYYEVREI